MNRQVNTVLAFGIVSLFSAICLVFILHFGIKEVEEMVAAESVVSE